MEGWFVYSIFIDRERGVGIAFHFHSHVSISVVFDIEVCLVDRNQVISFPCFSYVPRYLATKTTSLLDTRSKSFLSLRQFC